jgi:hypothetical protein
MKGTGLIINGEYVQVPGLNVINCVDDPRIALPMGKCMRLRHTRWIRAIGQHNTKNIEPVLVQGSGPGTDLGHRLEDFWSLDTTKPAGAHLAVDRDTTVYCMADLVKYATYHAGTWNEVSIGIEMFEDGQGHIYADQLYANIHLIEFLCMYFGIQRQTTTQVQQIKRIAEGKGVDCVGVFGHCNQWYAGKSHDPGIEFFKALATAGFKQFNFNKHEDKEYWGNIQTQLGVSPDGVPGPATRDALQARGFEGGLYDWRTAL